MYAEISRRLKLQNDQNMLPFAVISMKNNKAMGITTKMNIDRDNKRVQNRINLVCEVSPTYIFEHIVQINAIGANLEYQIF